MLVFEEGANVYAVHPTANPEYAAGTLKLTVTLAELDSRNV
jgi:hypothetical protein